MNTLIPAAFTPIKENKVDIEKIRELSDYYKKNKIHTVFICGTTGEFSNLSISERKLIAEEWIKTNLNVIVHVGSCSIRDSQELAIHAEKIGAYGIAAVPPFYFSEFAMPNSKYLTDVMHKIANCAPNLPFWYYHIPEFTSIANVNSKISITDVMMEMSKSIENFKGLKFSSSSTRDFISLKRIYPPIDIIVGNDLKISEWYSEYDNYICSSINLFPRLYQEMINHLKSKNKIEANNLQNIIKEFFELIERYKINPISAQKQLMPKLCGVDVGDALYPLEKISEEKLQNIVNDILKINGIKNYL